jgi:hypothetical protein
LYVVSVKFLDNRREDRRLWTECKGTVDKKLKDKFICVGCFDKTVVSRYIFPALSPWFLQWLIERFVSFLIPLTVHLGVLFIHFITHMQVRSSIIADLSLVSYSLIWSLTSAYYTTWLSTSRVVHLRHVKEPYTAWVRCFVRQISWPGSHPW